MGLTFERKADIIILRFSVLLYYTKNQKCGQVEERKKLKRQEKHMIVIKMENGGKIKIELDASAAPITAANFEKLVREGFYDGLISTA